jgi:CRP/FNR family transcriptional regulator
MTYHENAIWNLRNLRLFKDLMPEELHALSPLLNTHQYSRGQFIFHAGEEAERLYFLDKGTVKISVTSPEGEERILDIFRSGDTFGELFFGPDTHRMATAQTLSNVTVRTMAGEAFMGLMRTRPDLCLTFVRHLVKQQRRTLMRMEALMHIDAGSRLLAMLLDLAERCGQRTGDCYVLPENLTQGDLASMVGLNRSTVNLLINDYRRKGILGGQGTILMIHPIPARVSLKKAGLVLA